MFQVSASINYNHTIVPQSDLTNHTVDVWGANFYMSNNFELPKKFFISLIGSYTTRSVSVFTISSPTYQIYLDIKKRFFNDNLRVTLNTKGIIANRWEKMHYNVNGINTFRSNRSGWHRFIGLSASWRFNNFKNIKKVEENEYLKMIE